ncbi:putative membrane protein [Desulfitobacterium dichloroeliminans LMG P-21439]|uniref:Putative membrane protein n=1 Tax=Desulfitobacterium dichloroeliminans (strain LMG P-21439 / DCA1) TaxID=871963 RepID=L0F6F3_DESDL|nr:DUF1294 domain-containing protein [Desulfitobacterium dichloroeliminans]AGA69419.1 putative membrane protein [Desulfitobacterium dichloroeliminans LMG P-21439]
MSTSQQLWSLGILFLLMNSIPFFLMRRDKYLARRNRWRIPEKWFFTLAFLGGALGTLLGMRVFRHKTKHKTFTWGIPLLLLLNMGVIYLLLKYL